jgi:hypothetical protein
MRSKLSFLNRYVNRLLAYPLHFSVGFFFYLLFGSLKKRIKYDLFRRPHYAFGIYEAARRAKEMGIKKISIIEFGVANGRGLMAMILYAQKVSAAMGVAIEIIGFDSGEGLPVHEGYKDHPELYLAGDYPMQDQSKLKALLPPNARLILTNLITEDWTQFVQDDAPIGFVSIDVDYYSSTVGVVKHLHTISSAKLLPNSLFYLDDTVFDNHNDYQGELLAINEFNAASELRKFEPYYRKLKQKQRFYNELWLSQIFQLHCLDHPERNKAYRRPDETVRMAHNKYLRS